jgi:hypothetical protein
MSEELDLILCLILNVAIVVIALITAIVAFYLARLFKGTPFEKPWKTLYLIPIFMAGIGICELSGVCVLRIRALLSLAALLIFLYSLRSFYHAWQRTRAVDVLSPEEE